MIAQAKRMYILMIKENKLFSFSFSSSCFLKEMENLFSMFLLRFNRILEIQEIGNWIPLFEVNFSKNSTKTIRLFALDF